MAFLIAATGVAVSAPWWAFVLLTVAWLVALVLSIAWFTTRPRTVGLLPLGLAAIWFATVVGGARYLGWG